MYRVPAGYVVKAIVIAIESPAFTVAALPKLLSKKLALLFPVIVNLLSAFQRTLASSLLLFPISFKISFIFYIFT